MITNQNLKKQIIDLATIWWEGDYEIDDDSDVVNRLRQYIEKLFELEPDIRTALRDTNQYTVCGIRRYLIKQIGDK